MAVPIAIRPAEAESISSVVGASTVFLTKPSDRLPRDNCPGEREISSGRRA